MKNMRHILATVLILTGFAISGYSQSQQKLEELKAKTIQIAENATVGATLNKKANPNPSAIIEMDFFNGSFDTLSRTTYTYNANGEVLQETEYEYDYSTGTFVLTSRGLYTYNIDNQPTEYLLQSWEDTAWVNAMRQKLSYTPEGDNNEVLIEVWTGTSWMLYLGVRIDYTYNNNGMPTEILIQLNQTGSWQDLQKQFITYDSNSEPTEIITQTNGMSGWENNTKMVNMQWHRWGGIQVQQFNYAEIETWDGTQWVKSGRQTNTYNSEDMPLSSLTEDWDVNTYVNSSRQTWTYDVYGNQEIYIQEEYDISVPAWDTIAGDKSEFTYNTNNSIDTEVTSTYGSPGWEVNEKLLYEYQNTSGFGNNTSQVAVGVYPNPTTDVLNLKIHAKNFTVIVTDLNGRKVLIAQDETRLKVGHLSKGIYLVNVTSPNGTATIKFIKN